MDLELAKEIVNLMENFGEEAELYEDYSGKGMFGKTTAGVVVDNFNVLLTCIITNADSLVDCHGEPVFEDIQNVKHDNMGVQIIIY